MPDPKAPMVERNGGSVPVPDPTVLTTQMLVQRTEALRDYIETKLAGAIHSIETRLSGMDQAIMLRYEAVEKFPTIVDEKVGHLQALIEERFNSVAKQFEERDTRADQGQAAGSKAIDAAFSAQKEAVGEQNRSNALAIAKSEQQTTKQLDAISSQIVSQTKASDDKIDSVKTLIDANAKGTDGKIDDVKARMNQLEARLATGEGQKKGGTDTVNWLLGAIAALGVLFGIGVVIVEKSSSAPQVIYASPPPAPSGQSSIVTPIVPQK